MVVCVLVDSIQQEVVLGKYEDITYEWMERCREKNRKERVLSNLSSPSSHLTTQHRRDNLAIDQISMGSSIPSPFLESV